VAAVKVLSFIFTDGHLYSRNEKIPLEVLFLRIIVLKTSKAKSPRVVVSSFMNNIKVCEIYRITPKGFDRFRIQLRKCPRQANIQLF